MPDPIAEFEPTADDYHNMIEAFGDVAFRLDAKGRCTFLSTTWRARLGWDLAACVGKVVLRFMHAPDRETARRQWHLLRTGQGKVYRGEFRFTTASGGVCWMRVSALGAYGPSGELRGVMGLLTDISAAKATESELIAARAAAEFANKSKSEFLSTMSHELRTPLNGVIGLSESLLEDGPPYDGDRTKRYLSIIHQSGRQLLAKINDIIDLARIEAGRTRPNLVLLDLGSVCGNVVEVAQRDARAKSIALTFVRPEPPVRVAADERLIRQLLQNLVSNAVKFTGANGQVRIEVLPRPEGGASIAVVDSGIGIAADKIPQLFQSYSQGDASLTRQYAGTGLGLALVDRIARLHCATVSVRSTPGQGSTFTLEMSAEPGMPAKLP